MKILPLVSLALLVSCGWLPAQNAEPVAAPAPIPAPEGSEAPLLTNIRQLTFAGNRAGEGYFNADGTKLIFQSEREAENPFFQIYLLDLETGDTERISPGQGKTTCAWIHPDGKRVLFASTQDDPEAVAKQKHEFKEREAATQRRYTWDYDETYEIYEYDLAAKTYKNLTKTQGYDAEGAYSPDGKHIVFASNRKAYSAPESLSDEDRNWFKLNKSFLMDIFIMDADGGNVRQLTNTPGYDGGPFFSKDGKQICWRRFNRDGDRAEVFTMNVDGTGEKQLTSLGALSWAPYFHPSGEYLIFNTNLQGFANFELYLVDAAGTKEPVRVTWTDGFDGLACFTPDGTQVAWTTNRTSDKKSQIFIGAWDHAKAQAMLAQAPARKEAAPLTDTKPKAAPVPVPIPKAEAVAAASDVAGLRDSSPEITVADLKAHIGYLSSDELKGRMTGTEGERLATAYVAKAFETWGLAPYDERPTSLSYFQNFEFTAGADLGPENKLEFKLGAETISAELNKDWRPLSFSKLGPIDPSEIAFAGYGIEIPEGLADTDGSKTSLYTSYYHTDVKDKWVLMFRFVPEQLEGDERRKFMRFASLRLKAMSARQKGARGVIFVSGPNSKVKDELVELGFDASMADSGIAAISISTSLAEKLVKQAGKNLTELQTSLDKGEMMMGFSLPDTKVEARIDVIQQKAQGRNVIGRLKAKDPAAQARPALIVGAHIDHLGDKPNPSSRALGKEQSQIHHGADDNASGTAGLLEMAQYLADQQKQGQLELKRDIIFAAWSGEEMGLLGSADFLRETARKVKNDPDAMLGAVFCANLNMDMIGRLDKSVIIQGVGSSSIWPSEIEKRNAPVGLPITTQQDTYLSTDATAFYLREVPILSAFTGAHEDYHRPTDTADKINYEGTQKVTRFMTLVARGLATNEKAPDYIKVDRPKAQGQRAGMRAYLGSIPDYAESGVPGVKLSGVTKGSPVEKAGVLAGDIVIKLAGQEVKNLHEYSFVLGGLKVGEEVEVVVKRKDETLTMKVTPGSRE